MSQTFDISNTEVICKGYTISPYEIEISADTNNLSITDASVNVVASNLHLNNTSGASKNITGFVGEDNGHFLFVINISAQSVVLIHSSASSDTTNRLLNIGGVDKTLAQYGCAIYQYITSGSVNKWVQMA